jgi:hypothetical protein
MNKYDAVINHGSHIHLECFGMLKDIHIILPFKGCYDEFIWVNSSEHYYGILIIDNCVFTSSEILTTPIWRIPGSLNARINVKNVVIDGITLSNTLIHHSVTDSFFLGDGMKIVNVKRTEDGFLIHHSLTYDNTGSFHNCEFTNVYKHISFFYFVFLLLLLCLY